MKVEGCSQLQKERAKGNQLGDAATKWEAQN